MKKVAVVTGANGGIGKATMKLFRSKGWKVYGIDVSKSKDKHFFQVDLSDVNQVLDLCKSILALTPRIDVLVNNAAVQFNSPISNLPIIEWEKTLAVNARAPFLLSQGLLPALKRAKGNIVNISSVHAMATSKNISAYAASKGALSSFTRAAALEYASYGIRVNAILPGAVETNMLTKSFAARLHSKGKASQGNSLKDVFKCHPLKRISKPIDIAYLIFFLADSITAGTITGQEFVSDGGILAGLKSE